MLLWQVRYVRGGEIAAAAEDLRGLAAAAAAAQELCTQRARLERELHDKVRRMHTSLLERPYAHAWGPLGEPHHTRPPWRAPVARHPTRRAPPTPVSAGTQVLLNRPGSLHAAQ
jgi:hypothetical protein